MMFPTTTKTGRVVYDRKLHPFRWTDVRRVVETMETPNPLDAIFDSRTLVELGAVLWLWGNMMHRMGDMLSLGMATREVFGKRWAFNLLERGVKGYLRLWQRMILLLGD